MADHYQNIRRFTSRPQAQIIDSSYAWLIQPDREYIYIKQQQNMQEEEQKGGGGR